MQLKAGTVRSVVNIVLGALSFLMLFGGGWWYVGILSAIAALILGWPGRKGRTAGKTAAVVGTVLAIAGSLAYLVPQLIMNS